MKKLFLILLCVSILGAGCAEVNCPMGSHEEEYWVPMRISYPYIGMKGALRYQTQIHPAHSSTRVVCNSQ